MLEPTPGVLPFETPADLVKSIENEIASAKGILLALLTRHANSQAKYFVAIRYEVGLLLTRCKDLTPSEVNTVISLVQEEQREAEQKSIATALFRVSLYNKTVIDFWRQCIQSRQSSSLRLCAAMGLLFSGAGNREELLKVVEDSIDLLQDFPFYLILNIGEPDQRFDTMQVALSCKMLPFATTHYSLVFEMLKCAFNKDVWYRFYSVTGSPSGLVMHEFSLYGSKAPPVYVLNCLQQRALDLVLEIDWFWEGKVNFWDHFGLPEDRDGLKRLAESRSAAG